MEENETTQIAENPAVEGVAETTSAQSTETVQAEPKKKSKAPFIAIPTALVVALGGIFGALHFNSSAKAEWLDDYDAALNAAKESKKELLVAFTGVDWDQISETLFSGDSENPGMLETDEFAKKISKNYVLCHLDMPIDEDKISEEKLDDLYSLAMAFNIQALPSFILLNSEGVPYATLPYAEDMQSVDALVAKFEAEKSKNAKIADLKEKLEKSTGTKKVEVLDELFEIIPVEEQSSLVDAILEVPSLDPENKTGLLGKYVLIGTYAKAENAMRTGNADQAVKAFLEVAEGDVLEPVYKQEAYYMSAYVSFASGLVTSNVSRDQILGYLQKALEIYPEGEAVEGIAQTIESLKEADFDNPDAMLQ